MVSRPVFSLMISGIFALTPGALHSQGRPYTEGSVWELTMVRTTAGMQDDYLRSLVITWRRIHEEAKQQGLVLSYTVLVADASGDDDWDVMLMVEYKNWAALDGVASKFEPIEQRIVGNQEQSHQLMTQRLEIRRILGTKHAQELILKP